MTEIQQVLLEVEMDYAGHPYYVSGNALLHSISSDLSYREQQNLSVSHGIFVPSPYGSFPKWHSQNAGRPVFGSSLKPIESYQDLFLFRRPHHPWIIDGRPRDAHNTHDLKVQGDGNPILSRQSHISGQRHNWYIHFYIHGDTAPLDEEELDRLQVGGKRNYGYGETSLKDTKIIDTEDLDYSWIEDAEEHVLELVTPYVLESEHPKTDDVDIPWWWDTDIEYRRRKEAIVEQMEQYGLQTVDHGQVTRYEGNTPIKTAKKGIERFGSHSKYGFGEIMVRPV